MPRGEGIDSAVAQNHVGVGDAAQPDVLRGLHHHPVSLGELGRAHLHRGGAHLRVQERTRAPDHQRQERDGQEDLAPRRRGVLEDEAAYLPGRSGRVGHGREPDHQCQPGRDRHGADDRARPQQRHLGAVAQTANAVRPVDSGAVERSGAAGGGGRHRSGGGERHAHDPRACRRGASRRGCGGARDRRGCRHRSWGVPRGRGGLSSSTPATSAKESVPRGRGGPGRLTSGTVTWSSVPRGRVRDGPGRRRDRRPGD